MFAKTPLCSRTLLVLIEAGKLQACTAKVSREAAMPTSFKKV
jgi:hypothetical protein